MRTHRRSQRKQHGFTLIELMIVITISGFLAIYAGQMLVQKADEAVAESTGIYALQLKNATDNYKIGNFYALANGSYVAGAADPYAPTIAELRAMGHLPASFPLNAPSKQSFAIRITAISCPGASCQLATLGYSTTPYDVRGSTRYDLSATVATALGGYGGTSYINNETRLRGPLFDVPNPVAATGGIVGFYSYLDTTIYNQFVRINDTRDPNLQGNLTVLGGITSNNAVGATPVGFAACLRASMDSTGKVFARAADCVARLTIDPATADVLSIADAAGTQRMSLSQAGVLLAKNAAGTTKVKLDGSTGDIQTFGTNGTSGFTQDGAGLVKGVGDTLQARTRVGAGDDGSGNPLGSIESDGSVKAQRLILSGTFTRYTACTDAGAVARDVAKAAAWLVCSGGQWQPMPATEYAAAGGACTSPGVVVQENANGGRGLYCTSGGTLVPVASILSPISDRTRVTVSDGGVVPKPSCPGGTAGFSIAAQNTGLDLTNPVDPYETLSITPVDVGAGWRMDIKLGSALGSVQSGSAIGASATIQTFCRFVL
jgi:prepilin-type N-terminal cleavage/methylation domain-containing protein